MNLFALGLNHETACVELRERAAFSAEALRPALRELIDGAGGAAVAEAAILSTCNRTEIYCGANDDDGGDGRDGDRDGDGDRGNNGNNSDRSNPGDRGNNGNHANPDSAARVLDWLGRRTGLGRDALAANIYAFPNEMAVKHAFRVASGLDSMVLGEPQILGQMKDAFHAAATAGATGKVLNRLFQHTFSVAKQVRTHTAIGEGSVSVARAGVMLAQKIFADLGQQTALLIGAGETIELAARHLAESGVTNILIANRSIASARTVARGAGGEAIALAQIPQHLARADIVVSSTASTLPILGKGAVERALAARRHKMMFILDLAVPRDVEPEVGQLRDVYLYTVDDLKSVVEQHRGLRQDAAVEAEAIIDLQVVRFMRWMRSLEAVPVIRQLRNELDAAAQLEAGKAARRIQNGEDPQAVVRQLAAALAGKFAHHPSRALGQAGADGQVELRAAARRLFNLKR